MNPLPYFQPLPRPNRPGNSAAHEETLAVWPFGGALERARLSRERCDAFAVRAARIVAAFDDSLEPVRADNERGVFLFKSQAPTALINPAFEDKHPRKGGKFSAKGAGQSAGNFATTGARQMPPPRGIVSPRPKASARPANLAGLVLPKSRGRWVGERGEGVWLPRSLKARALAPQGIEFKAGFPVFEPHIHQLEKEVAGGQTAQVAAEVEMPTGFVGERPKDFAIADRIIAQKMGWTKRDGTPNAAKAERYRVEKRLVWHHHQDCDRPRMLLIPAIVHARAPHSGGHSLCAPSAS